jgi:predicted GIY-YIG superfamily endonuclease
MTKRFEAKQHNTAVWWLLDRPPARTMTTVKMLVYYEHYGTPGAAIEREKNIKHWPREWKIDLILSMNPNWHDLYEEIIL